MSEASTAQPGASPPAQPPAGAQPPASPPAATRPDWLPENHWDAKSGAIAPTFGQHYSEIAAAHKNRGEYLAALPKKPEDYKIEVKLPETVKLPDGFKVTTDDKDPRVPAIRAYALKHQLSQAAVDELVAFDAQMQIEAHSAEQARIAEQDKSLGANAADRKTAVTSWLKGLKDGGKISADEFNDAIELSTYATTITLFEKLQSMAAGSVPASGGGQPQPPKPSDVPMEQRWYGSSQKAS